MNCTLSSALVGYYVECKKMHGMNDIKKDFEAWRVLFAIYKLVLFESRVMGVMFELKTGNGRKRKDNLEFHNLYCLSGSRVSKNSGKWVRNASCMGVKVILKRVLIGKHEGKNPFRRPVCMWDDELDFKELYQGVF